MKATCRNKNTKHPKEKIWKSFSTKCEKEKWCQQKRKYILEVFPNCRTDQKVAAPRKTKIGDTKYLNLGRNIIAECNKARCLWNIFFSVATEYEAIHFLGRWLVRKKTAKRHVETAFQKVFHECEVKNTPLRISRHYSKPRKYQDCKHPKQYPKRWKSWVSTNNKKSTTIHKSMVHKRIMKQQCRILQNL